MIAESSEQLQAAWVKVSRSEAVRVVILSEAGKRAFYTGTYLKKSMPPKESFSELNFGESAPKSRLANLHTDKPVIEAINGYALGGGLEIALQCDIRIASSNAAFGLSDVCIGSILGAGRT